MHKLFPTNVGHVNWVVLKLSDFGTRLREERQRLKLNQIEFGERGGVSKNAQFGYERGDRSPDAEYLMALLSHGVDVHFLLSGVRAGQAESPLPVNQQKVLRLMGDLSAEHLDALVVLLEGLAAKR